MIELGLARVSQLLKHTPLPWRAIHVAGTNGKGSICVAASAMLHRAGIPHGRFTSPHLIDRWDCISINEEPIAEPVFREVERLVLGRNEREGINATEFELLTATAFELFTRAKIEIGVIETGMGGRLDATNVLEQPLVTVICKIGLDHQAFLGDTIEKIAFEKAGILKPGVPCVIEGTNKPSVVEVIQSRAKEISAGPVYKVYGLPDAPKSNPEYESFLKAKNFQPHEILNTACAHKATLLALEALGRKPDDELSLFEGLTDIKLPGRLQTLDLGRITSRKNPAILDGAHNADSAEALGQFVESLREKGRSSVVWVLSVSQGKAISEMLKPLLRDGDSVVAAEFGPVDGMPWVKATPAKDVIEAAKNSVPLKQTAECGSDVLAALKKGAELASSQGREAPLVVAGSLYLVSDVLRILRDT
ncbi:Folylpolyglutamate synthetase [Macrophomina phaseolina MS6]|uniref:Dihydrofolate synthetase n=2 Tax=Macrophomina phaseolina TaxID=35725 RepID=K2S9G8_MACPH|nr:Folylpolyglutamate synthetase [Macrophomina phaseolina MS6]KAH7030500.1 Mur ligase [Macrophomina phaseolina]